MNWLQPVQRPLPSLVDHLLSRLAGIRERRPYGEHIHASSLTDEEFCPREVVLLQKLGMKRREEFRPAALQATFDVGDAMADLHRLKWLRAIAVGDWECRGCGQMLRFTGHPGECATCSKDLWRYVEIITIDPAINAQGSLDLLVNLGQPKLTIVELKILSAEDFKVIKAPKPEHRIRTVLYMDLVRQGSHPFRHVIDTERAKVLYTARHWGAADPERKLIHPFREFDVVYDAESIAMPRHMAGLVKRYRESKVVPLGVCASPTLKRAQACKVCHACFSGQFPGVA